MLWPLARHFRRSGFSTSTFGYPSWWWSIEHHADQFRAHLDRIASVSSIQSFHIVAHSMGCIVTRQALLNSSYENLERIVMLAAPNHGSPVARFLGGVFPVCKTLGQLSSKQNSFVCQLPEPDDNLEIGIVAARHDRVIPEKNSHLGSETDHIVLKSGHNGLLVRPSAARQIVQFLNQGRFAQSKRQAMQSQA